jgi:hypothetical protein
MNSRAVLLHYLVVIERLEQAVEAIKANAVGVHGFPSYRLVMQRISGPFGGASVTAVSNARPPGSEPVPFGDALFVFVWFSNNRRLAVIVRFVVVLVSRRWRAGQRRSSS